VGRVIKARDLPARPRRLGAEAPDGEEERRRWTAALAEALERRDDEVIALAAAMARRLIGEAVSSDPVVLDGVYRCALDELGGLRPAVLRTNPRDAEVRGISELAGSLGIEVVADPAVARFSCVVEARGARVEHGLEPLIDALRHVAGRGAKG